MKAETNIRCNNCPDLEIYKRKITDNAGRIDRNTWRLSCGKLIIGIIDVRNKDLWDKKMPEIIPPFIYKLRQKNRIKGIESKFELQIN